MKIKTTILSIAALLLFSLTGCYEDPAPYTPVVMNSNMTIMQFKALYNNEPLIITRKDIVLAGKVISTDQYGNFYRSFFIQDTTANGGGIEIKIGLTGLYNTYKIGQVVYINPYDLCLGKYGELENLGYRSTNQYETGFMDIPAIINNAIFRGVQSTPVLPVDITRASDITEVHYGTWVTLKGATYRGGSYYLNQVTVTPWDKWAKKPDDLDNDTAYGEQRFALADGSEVIVRTSGYAKFADTTLPFAVGDKVNITGVLTKYRSNLQLILNTDRDVVPVL